jgi:hypothetical protein
VVALAAIAVGWAVGFQFTLPPKSRGYSVGVATASVLVDTPKSQVVEVDPKGSDTLGSRANVLANLMVDGEIKDVIAQRAGVAPRQLVANTESTAATAPPTPLTRRSLAYTTSVAMTSDMAELPIIRVETQAPTVSGAIMLANAAAQGLGEYLDARALDETVSDHRRLRVRPLGTAQGHLAARGPSKAMAVGAGLAVFLLGCGFVLALNAIIGGWRAAVAEERRAGAAEETEDAAEVVETPAAPPVEEPGWLQEPSPPTRLRA